MQSPRNVLIGLLIAVVVAGACTPAPSPAPAPTPAATALDASDDAEGGLPTRNCRRPCRGRPRTVGRFPRSAAPEASGLAASVRSPGLLYVVDDGPGTTSVQVIRARDGRRVARLEVAGLDGVDTEDLAVGPCGDGSCLYIADIGDNVAGRDSISITRVAEPALRKGAPPGAVSGEIVTLRYPDGPHDAEALLVHRSTMGIVTKAAGGDRHGRARLYLADGFVDQVLGRGPRVRLPTPRAPLAAAILGNVVTAGDATRRRVVLRTYDALYEFTAPPGEPAVFERFPRWPVRELPAPTEPQGEAVAYAADGCGLFTVSEDSPRLSSLPCR